jgi:hypothetical protein
MTRRPPEQVGYKHPPKETQFKPGVSGNPRGRPKGRVSLSEVLRKALLERVEIRENGRQRMASKLEVVMKQLVNKSASGDMRAIQFLAGLIGLYAPEATEQAAQDPLEAYDQQVLDSIAERMRRAAKAELEELLTPREPE